jgi:hypothetical protein
LKVLKRFPRLFFSIPDFFFCSRAAVSILDVYLPLSGAAIFVAAFRTARKVSQFRVPVPPLRIPSRAARCAARPLTLATLSKRVLK